MEIGVKLIKQNTFYILVMVALLQELIYLGELGLLLIQKTYGMLVF